MTQKKRKPRSTYNCSECPAYCCAVYEIVEVTKKDLVRLAKYFGISEEEAEKKHTKIRAGERVLRRQIDPVLGEACKFLDLETRRCTIYEGRPSVCRAFPPTKRCSFYDLLKFQREHSDDESMVPLITIGTWERAGNTGE